MDSDLSMKRKSSEKLELKMYYFKKRKYSEDDEVKLVLLENHTSIGFIPFYKSLLFKYRDYHSIEVFKGRSFKPGWFSGMTFISNNKNTIQILKLQSINNENNEQQAIMQQMSIIYKNTEFLNGNNNSLSYCKIIKTKQVLKEMANYKLYTNFDVNQESRYYNNVWKLISALWLKKGNPFEKKKELSKWLESVLEETLPDYLEIGLWNKERALINILTYLIAHKIKKASELAFQINMPQLSLLITQINSTNYAKYALRKQIKDWVKSTANETIKEEIYKIYLMLSGDDECINENFKDWLNCFGIIFWYNSSPNASINEALNLFKNGMVKYTHGLPKSQNNNNSQFDLIYLILLLYADKKTSLEKLFVPETHTNCVINYKISWLLMQTFDSLKIGVIPEDVVNQIHINYAMQLESIGLFTWSIFVLLHLKDVNVRNSYIMNILLRNIQIQYDSNSINKEEEHMLIHNFKIPAIWIEYVKAEKSTLYGNNWSTFAYHLNAYNFKQAHFIAMHNLIPKLFANNYLNEIINLLLPLKQYSDYIDDWNVKGGLILDFVILQQTFNVYQRQPMYGIRFDFIDRLKNVFGIVVNLPIDSQEMAFCLTILLKCYFKMITQFQNVENNFEYAHLI